MWYPHALFDIVHNVKQVNFASSECQFLAHIVDNEMRVYVRLKRTKSLEWIPVVSVLNFGFRWIGVDTTQNE